LPADVVIWTSRREQHFEFDHATSRDLAGLDQRGQRGVNDRTGKA